MESMLQLEGVSFSDAFYYTFCGQQILIFHWDEVFLWEKNIHQYINYRCWWFQENFTWFSVEILTNAVWWRILEDMLVNGVSRWCDWIILNIDPFVLALSKEIMRRDLEKCFIRTRYISLQSEVSHLATIISHATQLWCARYLIYQVQLSYSNILKIEILKNIACLHSGHLVSI